MITIQIKHNFETAHRLPFLGGKCENLHGHSWWVGFDIGAVDKEGGIDANGISVEYGQVKTLIRTWIDYHLDHGTMLGWQDPLCQTTYAGVRPYELLGKVFFFGGAPFEGQTNTYDKLPWPTVEAVAQMLSDKIQDLLDKAFDGLYVNSVHVKETHVNSATYIQGV